MAADPRRPGTRGVSVEERRGRRGPVFIGRYTLPTRRRPSLPAEPTWQQAYDAARRMQEKVNRARYRDPAGGTMTFGELVLEHYLPLQAELSPVTRKNIASHLGDGTGRARGQGGAKTIRAARHALLTVFGPRPLEDIGPHDIRMWQAELVRDKYQRGTILAKRSLLRAILEHARVNGWLELNPVDPVPLPIARQTVDRDRVITPAEWARVRAGICGAASLLFVDVALDTGLRFSELTALRAMDLIDANDRDPQHLWVRTAVAWPGREHTEHGGPWQIKEPKGRRWRRVAVTGELYARLCAYVEQWHVAPAALVFDSARMRAEHSTRRARDPRPERFPRGRYVSAKTGQSGEHGRANTYNLGCRCPYCTNAASEYRFWWARSRGRQAAKPWEEPRFAEARSEAVDPVPHDWFGRAIWKPAVVDAGLDWSPTFHGLRHAMVSWALEGGARPSAVQRDAGHASMRTTEIYIHRLDDRVGTERLRAMEVMYQRMLVTAAQPAVSAAAGPRVAVTSLGSSGVPPSSARAAQAGGA